MGLISKTADIRLSSSNMKWFEEKGYYLPRIEKIYPNRDGGYKRSYAVPQGTKIKVKVEDLKPTSSAKVKIKCDFCKKEYETTWRYYIKLNHEGKTYCRSCANKVLNSGENSSCWNSNKTQDERENDRSYPEYREFIYKVLVRDNFTCIITGKTVKESELEVHHLNGYNWCIEGRLDVKNAVTITKGLHKAFHSKYGYGNNTKEQFLDFIESFKLNLEDYIDKEIPSIKIAYCVTDNEIIENIIQYAKNNNVDSSSIYKCCNKKQFMCKNKIYMWYDEYLSMDDKQIRDYINKCNKNNNRNKIACTNYNLLFDSTVCAEKYYGICNTSILSCLHGKYRYAGKHPTTNEKLMWEYAYKIEDIEKYTHISREKCEQIQLLRNDGSLSNDSFIM